jgi:hypothetical protein
MPIPAPVVGGPWVLREIIQSLALHEGMFI